MDVLPRGASIVRHRLRLPGTQEPVNLHVQGHASASDLIQTAASQYQLNAKSGRNPEGIRLCVGGTAFDAGRSLAPGDRIVGRRADDVLELWTNPQFIQIAVAGSVSLSSSKQVLVDYEASLGHMLAAIQRCVGLAGHGSAHFQENTDSYEKSKGGEVKAKDLDKADSKNSDPLQREIVFRRKHKDDRDTDLADLPFVPANQSLADVHFSLDDEVLVVVPLIVLAMHIQQPDRGLPVVREGWMMKLSRPSNPTAIPEQLSLQEKEDDRGARTSSVLVPNSFKGASKALSKKPDRRYFVQRGSFLLYFHKQPNSSKASKQVSPSAVIPLEYYRVKSVTAQGGQGVAEKSKGFAKGEAVPAISLSRGAGFSAILGSAERSASSDYVLCPISRKDATAVTEWQTSLQLHSIQLSEYAVFGVRLTELCERESRADGLGEKNSHMIPAFVQRCVDYLSSKRGLASEGIFRHSGAHSVMQYFRDQTDNGITVTFSARPGEGVLAADVNVVAGLLKLYLRLLPDPLIPCAVFEDLEKAQVLDPKAPDIEKILAVLSGAPPEHQVTLRLICSLGKRIAEHEDQTRMSSSNLATCLGPCLVRNTNTADLDNDAAAGQWLLQKSASISALTIVLIENFERIAPDLVVDDENAKMRRGTIRVDADVPEDFLRSAIAEANLEDLTGDDQTADDAQLEEDITANEVLEEEDSGEIWEGENDISEGEEGEEGEGEEGISQAADDIVQESPREPTLAERMARMGAINPMALPASSVPKEPPARPPRNVKPPVQPKILPPRPKGGLKPPAGRGGIVANRDAQVKRPPPPKTARPANLKQGGPKKTPVPPSKLRPSLETNDGDLEVAMRARKALPKPPPKKGSPSTSSSKRAAPKLPPRSGRHPDTSSAFSEESQESRILAEISILKRREVEAASEENFTLAIKLRDEAEELKSRLDSMTAGASHEKNPAIKPPEKQRHEAAGKVAAEHAVAEKLAEKNLEQMQEAGGNVAAERAVAEKLAETPLEQKHEAGGKDAAERAVAEKLAEKNLELFRQRKAQTLETESQSLPVADSAQAKPVSRETPAQIALPANFVRIAPPAKADPTTETVTTETVETESDNSKRKKDPILVPGRAQGVVNSRQIDAPSSKSLDKPLTDDSTASKLTELESLLQDVTREKALLSEEVGQLRALTQSQQKQAAVDKQAILSMQSEIFLLQEKQDLAIASLRSDLLDAVKDVETKQADAIRSAQQNPELGDLPQRLAAAEAECAKLRAVKVEDDTGDDLEAKIKRLVQAEVSATIAGDTRFADLQQALELGSSERDALRQSLSSLRDSVHSDVVSEVERRLIPLSSSTSADKGEPPKTQFAETIPEKVDVHEESVQLEPPKTQFAETIPEKVDVREESVQLSPDDLDAREVALQAREEKLRKIVREQKERKRKKGSSRSKEHKERRRRGQDKEEDVSADAPLRPAPRPPSDDESPSKK